MKNNIQTVALFCGSRPGLHPEYAEAAGQMGRILAQANIELVFGGGHIGLMGIAADAALAQGGKVTGVIPKQLMDLELAHPKVSQLISTQSMHERKAIMATRADVFVVLPGGFGTCDEFFEILTWRQLNLHLKPIALLNTRGFFTPMLAWLDHMVTEGFLCSSHRAIVEVAQTPETLWAMLQKQKTVTTHNLKNS